VVTSWDCSDDGSCEKQGVEVRAMRSGLCVLLQLGLVYLGDAQMDVSDVSMPAAITVQWLRYRQTCSVRYPRKGAFVARFLSTLAFQNARLQFILTSDTPWASSTRVYDQGETGLIVDYVMSENSMRHLRPPWRC
jgi:hypothetical protein